MSKMMRISQEASKSLDLLADLIGKPKQLILEKALENFLREQFIKKTNEEYALIKASPDLWAQEIEEQEAWDATLNDELEAYE